MAAPMARNLRVLLLNNYLPPRGGAEVHVTAVRDLLRALRDRGRIELRDGVEAHRLADKGAAIRACDSCHQAGAEPFRYVAVSVTGPDGRPLRHAVRPQVLNSPQAFVALPAFYAVGGTRSPLLDALFVLALLGGASFPIGHLTVRWLARRFRS